MYQSLSGALLFALLLLLFMPSCEKKVSDGIDDNPIDGAILLKDKLASYFPLGVAAGTSNLATDEASMIAREFNSFTPDNAMKWKYIHPQKGTYSWEKADSIVNFAIRNSMKVRGHVLVWHNPNSFNEWVTRDENGNRLSKAIFLQQMKEHIYAVVGRYKGKIYAWDVVNEAISDDPATQGSYIKNYSDMYRIAGKEYIFRAFQYAHEADPGAKLFYNDYGHEDPAKRERIYRLIKEMKDSALPIHGVGMQAHWWSNEPRAGQLDSTLKKFTDLGVEIQITELDISVYPHEDTKGKTAADFNTEWNQEKEAQLVANYKMCFEAFKKYKQYITGVTFWNVSDRYSWRTNYPVVNRNDYPLLFDKNLKPKKAYEEVLKLFP